KCPAELYSSSCRPYQGLQELSSPFHDKTVVVTNCGRLCLYRKKINLRLVRFMDYDLGYVDLEEKTLPNPFGPKVLPMS
ncbi:MAG TPA: hypothetical protein VKV74_05455, partial [Bryobacteraceae bacterium]|nr:hypothetical protein [Bryobacteraceae bacterium]